MVFRLKEVAKYPIIILIIGLVIVLIPGCSLWGSPTRDLSIINKTNQTLKVYVNDYFVGEATPNEKIVREDVGIDIGKYLVVAKSINGKEKYSKEYTTGELFDIKWQIEITIQ
jgi:hypothetical protein